MMVQRFRWVRLIAALCGLAGLSLCVSEAYAATVWVRSGSGTGGPFYETPQKACRSYRGTLHQGETITTRLINSQTAECSLNSWGNITLLGQVRAVTIDDEPDPEPSLPTPEECLQGGPGIFSKTGPVVGSNGTNYVIVPGGGSVCYGQCSHSLAERAASCYSSGDGTSGFCNYIGTPTGETCTESDAPLGTTGQPLNPPDTPDAPPSDPNDPGCPPGYGWSGTTCAKYPDDGGEGGGDEGDGGGDGDDGGGSDGGSGDGSGGGSDDGGNGNGNGNGDGDGNDNGSGGGGSGGSGDGEGQDGDEQPESSVGGEACDATLSCEGDAVQCAILRQQKTLRCEAIEQADFDKKKGDIEGLFQGEEFELGTAEVQAPSFINAAARFLPSGCPTPESMSLRSNGGRTLQIKYEPLCQAATDMSWLIVAFTSLFAAVYVGRAFGGS